MEEIISLGQVKSKKWCESRFNAGFEKLMRQYNPDFKMTAKVKIEPMALGKAPRLLIADGDTGQLMALLGIHIFEELLFRKYHKRSIKHRSRKSALMEVHQYLNGPKGETKEGSVIEGDGSSWDTCCSEELRKCVENPVMQYITDVLLDTHICPHSWHETHMAANEKPKLKLHFEESKATNTVSWSTYFASMQSGGQAIAARHP